MAEPHLASAQFGGFWIRFVALLADSAIVFLVMALILGGAAAALGFEGMAPAVWIAWLFSFLYWPVMQASGQQATVGKAILGLKVTGYQGNRLSFLRSLGRELAKILSSMVLMVGFIMAAFTGRKQALHDLVASTYVVQEGKARVVAALATAVAGFALPVVVLPMLVGDAVMGMMTEMAASVVMEPQASPPPVVQRTAPKPQPPKPAPVQVAAPAPVQVALQPAPVAPAPAPVVVPAKPAPVVAAAEPTPKVAPKPITAAKPKAESKPKGAAKPKAAPVRVAAAPKPRPSNTYEPKATAGPKYNDLMTAVLYKDAEGVAELLKLGKWPDKPDSHGATPLMRAVALGDAATAEALLRGGANAARAVPVAEEQRDPAMLTLLKRYPSR